MTFEILMIPFQVTLEGVRVAGSVKVMDNPLPVRVYVSKLSALAGETKSRAITNIIPANERHLPMVIP